METAIAPSGAKHWLTLSEAASYLGKPNSWVYDNVRKLGIPFVPLGRQYRFSTEQLDQWMLKQMENRLSTTGI